MKDAYLRAGNCHPLRLQPFRLPFVSLFPLLIFGRVGRRMHTFFVFFAEQLVCLCTLRIVLQLNGHCYRKIKLRLIMSFGSMCLMVIWKLTRRVCEVSCLKAFQANIMRTFFSRLKREIVVELASNCFFRKTKLYCPFLDILFNACMLLCN